MNISFEIIPPLRGGSFQKLEHVIAELAEHNPQFIDVTSHSAKTRYIKNGEGYKLEKQRRRPGTLGTCAVIQHKYGIPAVPHVLCNGFTKRETEDFLIELHYMGINRIMALKGDGNDVKDNMYASDLVTQIHQMNNGNYNHSTGEQTEFKIGVAGYPEKHFQSPNKETDLKFLKQKMGSGADYIITQMFFDNKTFFDYVNRCRNEGIESEIIPGLKVLTNARQLTTLPSNFYLNIPYELSSEVQKRPEEAKEIGVEWCREQIKDLKSKGYPIHLYVMQDTQIIKEVLK